MIPLEPSYDHLFTLLSNPMSITLNIMILQYVRWMDLKIGEHLDIQINYKILQLQLDLS